MSRTIDLAGLQDAVDRAGLAFDKDLACPLEWRKSPGSFYGTLSFFPDWQVLRLTVFTETGSALRDVKHRGEIAIWELALVSDPAHYLYNIAFADFCELAEMWQENQGNVA